jgi:glutamate dehydrogenase/leucine dehydrogenase
MERVRRDGAHFESVRGFYERGADRLKLPPSLREMLARPEQELSVQVRVPMDDGTIALYQGYRIRAGLVLEVANNPVTPDADRTLAERGVTVVPDILSSAGGVVVSYLEWAQNMQHERWREKRVNDRLAETMRDAAYGIGVDRVAEAERARGYL